MTRSNTSSNYRFNPLYGVLAAASAGLYMSTRNTSECEAELKPNEIKGRINGAQYDGNAPIEDRMSFY